MPVVIDEVVSETAAEAVPVRADSPASAPAAEFDFEAASFEQSRRRHRLQRLWAD